MRVGTVARNWLLLSAVACTGCGGLGQTQPTTSKSAPTESALSSTRSESDPATTSTNDDVQLPRTENSRSNKGAQISFRVAENTGIRFQREDDMRGQKRIFESTGGGVGVIDFDADGESDLVFMGGCKVPEQLNSPDPTCALYRNLGGVRFRDITLSSNMLKSGYCQGVAVGDYDNDGFDDLYITALGSNAFFRNMGDGTFQDVTQPLGVDDERWSTSCAFADLNLDGSLDLYVVNYLADSPTEPLLCRNERSPTGFEQCPPAKYSGVNDRLFLGDGHGGFVDVTESSGLMHKKGRGLGVVVCDFDQQGLPEIYVCNDGQANFLFKINIDDHGILKLDEIALSAGAALSSSGYAQASMGVAVGDYDRDGLIDLHVTNFSGDYNTIYKNYGDLRFEDVTRLTGLVGPTKKYLGWGTVFTDFDGDAWLDLFVANGHVEDRTWNGRGELFQMPPQLFRNLGNGKFEDVSLTGGSYFEESWLGRGVALADLNHDHAVDLVVAHQSKPPSILINQSTVSSRAIRFVGTTSNRNGIGVRIQAEDSGSKIHEQVVGGGSYLSAGYENLYVRDQVKMTVHWPRNGSISLEVLSSDVGVLMVEDSVY